MKQIIGGSNDSLWYGVGQFMGKQANCITNHPVKHMIIPGYCLSKILG
ncbi:enterocin B precursor, partial [Enterococcus faecium]